MSAQPGKQASKRRLHNRMRLIRVYAVALRIGLSYLGLKIGRRILGQTWHERRRSQVHFQSAQRIEKVIVQVKGLFVKIGQLLSILTQVLPADFRRGLQGVQDQIPERPLEDVYARIHSSFGQPAEALFQSFDPKPLASASLAQVHRATLGDGTQVAVKVQHYDIETMAELDLRTFRRLLKLVGFFFKIRGLDHVYLQVREMILAELDFSREADHLKAISKNFEGSNSIRFPRVIPEFSEARVLTTTYVAGIKITDLRDAPTMPVTRTQIAQRLLETYLQMLIEHGLFHADPHPGNLLITSDGALVFLDFGAIGTLPPEMKSGIPKFLQGVVERDPIQIQKALAVMGFLQSDRHSDTLQRMIEYLQNRFMGETDLDQWHVNALHFDMQTKFEIMADFRKLKLSTRELMNTFQVPKSWVILHRTLVLLLGLVSELDPQLKPIPIVRPFLQNLILENKGNLPQQALRFLRETVQKSLSLPKDLHRVIGKLERGELEVRLKGYHQRTRLLYALGQQGFCALGCFACAFLSYDAWKSGAESLHIATAWASGVFALGLVAALISARKWLP